MKKFTRIRVVLVGLQMLGTIIILGLTTRATPVVMFLAGIATLIILVSAYTEGVMRGRGRFD